MCWILLAKGNYKLNCPTCLPSDLKGLTKDDICEGVQSTEQIFIKLLALFSSICDFYLIFRAGVKSIRHLCWVLCWPLLPPHFTHRQRVYGSSGCHLRDWLCHWYSSGPKQIIFFPSLAPGTKVAQFTSSLCEIQGASVQVQYDINTALVLFSSLIHLLDTALSHTHVPCYRCL